MNTPTNTIRLPAILTVVLLTCDRLLKIVAIRHFKTEPLHLVPNVVDFSFFANRGIAFSIPFSGPLLWALSIALILIFSSMLLRRRKEGGNRLLFAAYLLFIAGAASNLYDRILMGYTVDYLIFFGRSAVNLADGMIIAGAAILIRGTKKEAPRPLSPHQAKE